MTTSQQTADTGESKTQLQAQLEVANKACNELAAALDDMRRQRDYWHARLTAEVLDRSKTLRGAA
jgi:hypothetical protein